MKRLPDWPQRLFRAIDERAETPFAWGALDCALYASDLIAAETGEDIGAQFRGTYSDEAGAAAVLKANGWAGLEDLADAYLPRQMGRPRRGDAILAKGRYGPFLGIVWGGGVIGAGPRRPITWDMETLRKDGGILGMWSVG